MDATDASRPAQRALKRQLRLAQQGRSMLYPFIGRSKRFEFWRHYPPQDVIDQTGRWQFYFHAHEVAQQDATRHPQEHGHIHLFRRHPAGQLSHLVALSLDARGLPLCWFTTNQWVTAGRWASATSLGRDLSTLELRLHGPLSGVALWLTDLVHFYADGVRNILLERDAALARHCALYRLSPAQARVDRRVAVWSSVTVDWPADALQMLT